MLTKRPTIRMPAVLVAGWLASTACFNLDDPTDPALTSILSVAAEQSQLEANGVSSTLITATLAKETASGTEVVFATDAGTLTGSGTTSGKELKVTAAGSRTISVRLVAPSTVGIATVTSRTGSGFAATSVELIPAHPDVVQLSADVVTGRANGQDAIVLTAAALRNTLGERVTQGTRVVFDVIRDGAKDFQLSGLGETNAEGVATRRLVSRVAGTCVVIASSGPTGNVKADTISVAFTAIP